MRYLGDDVAIVVSRTAVLMAGEAAPPDDRWVLATWTLTRQDGSWLLAACRSCAA